MSGILRKYTQSRSVKIKKIPGERMKSIMRQGGMLVRES